MKKNMYKSILKLLAFSVVSLGLFANSVYAAGNGTITLSPATASIEKDKTVAVAINTSSDEEYNTVQVDLTYDQSALEYVGIDGSGSAFDSPLPSSGGNGSVQVSRGSTVGLSGNKKVATVNFKALQGSGSSTITVAGTSLILRTSDSQNVWNGAGATSVISQSTPANAKPTTSAKKTTPAPVVADDAPVPVAAASTDEGYLVSIQVYDYMNKGVEGIVVDLGDKKATSDKNGIASFTNIVAGEYTVKAFGVSKKITVAEGDSTVPQNFTINQADSSTDSNRSLILIIGMILLLVLLGVVSFYGKHFLEKRKAARLYPIKKEAEKMSILNDETKEIDIEKAFGPNKIPRPESVIHPNEHDKQ